MPKPPRPRDYTRGPHLYQRPSNGVWYVYTADGRKTSTGSRDHDEAAAWMSAHLADLTADDAQPAGSDATLAAVAAAFLAAPLGYTRRSKGSLQLRLEAIDAWLRARVPPIERVRNLTPAAMDEWVEERARTASRATINRDLRALKVCLRWGAERELCPRCAAVLDRPELREPTRSRRHVVPDPAEMRRVLDHLEVIHRGAMIAVSVLYGCGLRIEELRRLTVGDLRDGAVWVRPEEGPADTAEPTKGYAERPIPIAPEVQALVTRYLAWRARGSACAEGWLLRYLHRACDAAKVPRCGLHDLRRGFATEAHRAGVPILVISHWLGHAAVATTERYLAVYRSDRAVTAPVPGGLVAAPEATVQSLAKATGTQGTPPVHEAGGGGGTGGVERAAITSDLAEEEGFGPPDGVTRRRFSRPFPDGVEAEKVICPVGVWPKDGQSRGRGRPRKE